ncbi:MAG TPA: glycerophosphodiester phosphodiesterase [Acidimicrobiales bacterium]|nr:glycerophosphodiester phosphodiesterase [Acidimicrobiales bacterium]
MAGGEGQAGVPGGPSSERQLRPVHRHPPHRRDLLLGPGLTLSRLRSWPFLDWPHPIAFAHRGGAADHPENTMVAFSAAVGLGYRYLETDVHVTSDGVLVAFHDHTLDRVTDRRGRIAELPYSYVSKARVGGEPIPLLEDILGTWPEARVNIDAKHDAAVPALVDAVNRTGAHDRVNLGSFSNRRVERIRELTGNRVCTWMGSTAVIRLRLHSWGLPPPRRLRAACAQVPICRGRVPVVDRRLVEAAHRQGLVVHVWTVNERPVMERLVDLGVDGIFSDRPAVLKDVLTERGLWE